MPHFVKVAKTTQVPEGQMLHVEADGTGVVLVNLGGTIYALEDLCTHDGGPLGEGQVEDNQLICPRHGARFDIRSGKAMAMPAFEPVPVFDVRVDGEEILVDL